MGLRSHFGEDLTGLHLFTDFDGTLSEIVNVPDAAVAVDGVDHALADAVSSGAAVTVVSGRSVGFLDSRLTVSGAELVGLYGLERLVGDEVCRHPSADQWIPTVSAVRADAEATFSGLTVESKELSLTLHYRDDPSLRPQVERWAAGVGESTGLEVRSARMSVELHPPVEVDKGTAVIERIDDATTAVVMIGDDVGDLPAFRALDACGPAVRTLRVVVASAELDPRVAALADLTLDSPADVVDFLLS